MSPASKSPPKAAELQSCGAAARLPPAEAGLTRAPPRSQSDAWSNRQIEYDLGKGQGTYCESAFARFLREQQVEGALDASSYIIFPDVGAHSR